MEDWEIEQWWQQREREGLGIRELAPQRVELRIVECAGCGEPIEVGETCQNCGTCDGCS